MLINLLKVRDPNVVTICGRTFRKPDNVKFAGYKKINGVKHAGFKMGKGQFKAVACNKLPQAV